MPDQIDITPYTKLQQPDPMGGLAVAGQIMNIKRQQQEVLGNQEYSEAIKRATKTNPDGTTSIDTNALQEVLAGPGFANARITHAAAPIDIQTGQLGVAGSARNLANNGFGNVGLAFGSLIQQQGAGAITFQQGQAALQRLLQQGQISQQQFNALRLGMPKDPAQLKNYLTSGWLQSLGAGASELTTWTDPSGRQWVVPKGAILGSGAAGGGAAPGGEAASGGAQGDAGAAPPMLTPEAMRASAAKRFGGDEFQPTPRSSGNTPAGGPQPAGPMVQSPFQPAVGLPGPEPGAQEAIAASTKTAGAARSALTYQANAIGPDQRADLQRMLADIKQTEAAGGTGPAAQDIGTLLAVYNQLTGQQIGADAVASWEGFRKVVQQMLVRQGQVAGTDYQTQVQMGALPGPGLSTKGNKRIISMLLGNQDAISLKDGEFDKWKSADPRRSDANFLEWSRSFNRNFDPRIFQSQYMDDGQPRGPEHSALYSSMTPTEQKTFRTKYNFAIAKGWIPASEAERAGAIFHLGGPDAIRRMEAQ